MSGQPSDGYGQYGSEQQNPQASAYDDHAGQEGITQEIAGGGKKKKRGYAAGAFDVGSGANAGVGGQTQGAGQFGMPPTYPQNDGQQPAQGYGYSQGYGAPAPQQQQQQQAQQQQPQPAYGEQPTYAGGYQAPDQSYPAPGAQIPPGAQQVGGITSGMANMNMGGQAQQQPTQAGRPMPLNQLHPSDLLNQPFNVAELDLSPPQIILPPNVSLDKLCL